LLLCACRGRKGDHLFLSLGAILWVGNTIPPEWLVSLTCRTVCYLFVSSLIDVDVINLNGNAIKRGVL
jgi:hypothetical protein